VTTIARPGYWRVCSPCEGMGFLDGGYHQDLTCTECGGSGRWWFIPDEFPPVAHRVNVPPIEIVQEKRRGP